MSPAWRLHVEPAVRVVWGPVERRDQVQVALERGAQRSVDEVLWAADAFVDELREREQEETR